ncbi:hypothetical protein [Occallatibacter riparius]|uniref:Uncharacterized protein n=1 Tax=Occallatibacter riparius TaxID=1002689 RepID=A0A9J7BPV8_9BACT|nr:hypothetical protein [Occallatibacter riparius]UWZ84744.1 hypothetical protein MOP44_02130 [Occallatibacter riparius]
MSEGVTKDAPLPDESSSLLDEYKILQDKIDKIGGFRVTIKGWSVTATVAALIAITTGKGFSPIVSAFGLDALLAWFFWFEREQVSRGWKFNARARSIEIQIEKRQRAAGKRVTFSSPNIARALFGGKKRRELISHEFENRHLESSRFAVNEQFRLAVKSDLLFYVTLCLAAWLPIWFGGTPASTAPPIVIHDTIQVPAQTSSQSGQPATGGISNPASDVQSHPKARHASRGSR